MKCIKAEQRFDLYTRAPVEYQHGLSIIALKTYERFPGFLFRTSRATSTRPDSDINTHDPKQAITQDTHSAPARGVNQKCVKTGVLLKPSVWNINKFIVHLTQMPRKIAIRNIQENACEIWLGRRINSIQQQTEFLFLYAFLYTF